MKLDLDDHHGLLLTSFDELFSTESSSSRVRAAEQTGFDAELWNSLTEVGAVSMLVTPEAGGGGGSLFDAALILDRAGAYTASVPLAEAMLAGQLLEQIDSRADHLRALVDGSTSVLFAPRPLHGPSELVRGGVFADAIVGLRGDDLVLLSRPQAPAPTDDLGNSGLARWDTTGPADVLATGADAHRLFSTTLTQWRILAAAALVGLSRKALELGAAYASERVQFDRRIGEFQGIAHPLANGVTEIEGARLLLWDALIQCGEGGRGAHPTAALAFGWAAEAAARATGTALHTLGGYGLALEYDLQLYQRRAKAWSALAGDPRAAYLDAARGLWDDEPKPAPSGDPAPVSFELGPKAETFRASVQEFLASDPPSAHGCDIRDGWDGHRPAFHAALAQAGFAFAGWPTEYGGSGRDPYEMTAMLQELYSAGVSLHPIANARMVGEALLKFAATELLDEVMPRLCAGDVITCLGYSEPESGSDVAAAQTKAVRDGDEWLINGQKMFTSGADICDYVFLLTRTDPDVPKHRGLTMFLVPLDSPGIEIQPLQTLSDEKTNATFYTNVRVPDRYRVGDVDKGMSVVGYALEIEHGGGGVGLFARAHLDALEAAVDWATTAPLGDGTALDDPLVRVRLARVTARARISALFNLRSLWRGAEGHPNRAEGPMSKLFSAEAYIEDAADLVDLAAPESLLTAADPASIHDGELEFGYRLSAATSIYGGSSEIMRSIIAEVALGMPRSRS
ncbi:MAG: acyl-CoA dehydrogenase [Acidimicrobiales bacterium]|nr:acyl-CoA dehydrogenase [Acidimicrobiales bacterium]